MFKMFLKHDTMEKEGYFGEAPETPANSTFI